MHGIKEEDILGLCVGEECVAWAYLTQEEISNMTQEQLILEQDLKDDEFLFCDRSGKLIKAL